MMMMLLITIDGSGHLLLGSIPQALDRKRRQARDAEDDPIVGKTFMFGSILLSSS